MDELFLPVNRVHVDYSVKGGPGWLRTELPDEAEKLMKTPFAIIQVSHPLTDQEAVTVCRHHTLPK